MTPPPFCWPNFQAKVWFSYNRNPPFLGMKGLLHYHSTWTNVAPCVEDMDLCSQCATFGTLV